MKNMLKIFKPTTFFVRLIVVMVILGLYFTIGRLVFFTLNYKDYLESSMSDILYAFWMGLRLDFKIIPFIMIPLAFLSLLKPFRIIQIITKLGYFLALNVMVFLLGADYFFYQYTGSRLNITIMSEINEAGMLKDSYPWGIITILVVLFMILNFFLADKMIKYLFKTTIVHISARIPSFLYMWILFAALVQGRVNKYSLNWSDAFFSANKQICMLGLNPIYYFYSTYNSQETEIDIEAIKKVYPLMADYLRIQNPSALNFTRVVNSKQTIFKEPPNIVIILSESLGLHQSSITNPLNVTPFIKNLSKESIYFPNFFSNANITKNSIYAVITSIMNMTFAGFANPLFLKQTSLLNYLTDYQKLFITGSSANWSHLRSFIHRSINDVKIYDRADFPYADGTYWGILDYNMLEESNKIFKNMKEPFVSVILTVTHHRPFAYNTSEFTDFKPLEIDSDDLYKYGFAGDHDMATSLQFFDYSLENFFKIAKNEHYFNNTVFVILGDHGVPVNADHMDDLDKATQLTIWRVPLLIYSPKYLKPRVVDTLGSQVDIMPTILSLIGREYQNQTMGEDILSLTATNRPGILCAEYFKRPQTTYFVTDKFLMVTEGEDSSLYKRNQNDLTDYFSTNSDIGQMLKNLSTAIYDTSKYMIKDNQ